MRWGGLVVVCLGSAVLAEAAAVRSDEPQALGDEPRVAYRVVYLKDAKQKVWNSGIERFSSYQAADTTARRLMAAKAVYAAGAEAFDPATGKRVDNPRPMAVGAQGSAKSKPSLTAQKSARSDNPSPSAGLARQLSPAGTGDRPPGSTRDDRPFLNLGGISVTNDFLPRRRAPRFRGWLAAQSESSDRGPSAISSGAGDPGGRSYGTFQLRSNRENDNAPSNVERFVDRYYRQEFKGKPRNSIPFMETWLRLSLEQTDAFRKNEADFIQADCVDPMMRRLEKGDVDLSLNNRSDALREVLWSIAVQHGPGRGAALVGQAVEGQDIDALSDRDLIKALYDERLRKGDDGSLAYFSSNDTSDKVRAGIELRFAREQNEALAALASEPTTRQELRRRAKKAQDQLKDEVRDLLKKDRDKTAQDSNSTVSKPPR